MFLLCGSGIRLSSVQISRRSWFNPQKLTKIKIPIQIKQDDYRSQYLTQLYIKTTCIPFRSEVPPIRGNGVAASPLSHLRHVIDSTATFFLEFSS